MLTLSHRQRRASLRRKHVFGFKSEFWKFDHMICTISLKLGQPEFAVIVIEKNFLKSKKCVNSSGIISPPMSPILWRHVMRLHTV